MRKKFLLIVILCIWFLGFAQAQTATTQDTMYSVRLKEVDVTAQRKWANDTARYRYNQMRYYVTTILPYLNAATQLFTEINTKLNEPGISRRERKQFISSKEDEMRNRFENEVRKLNVTQGVLLVKLIGRQTDVNIYRMLQQFKNPFEAIKWQAWARMNGLNLNGRYRPEAERDLESIMIGLGYPLPASYKNSDADMNF